MEMKEFKYILALSFLSTALVRDLYRSFNNYSPEELYNLATEDSRFKIMSHLRKVYPGSPLEVADQVIRECQSKKIKILTILSDKYPLLLKEIADPPLVLYLKGVPHFKNCFAIVGTRNSDKVSSAITRQLAAELSAAGLTIVSGMARGVDREAHEAVLGESAPTIAVLPNGIDIVSPLMNRDIYKSITESENSALVSEYPPGIYAGKWTFVRRNRIISGLARGTLIVKAAERSGAMITARYAIEQNREVFACPGYSFNQDYFGCNRLIKDGAVLVSDTSDILSEFKDLDYNRVNIKQSPVFSEKSILEKSKKREFFSKYADGTLEKEILLLLSKDSIQLDELIRKLGYSAADVQQSLLLLELDGLLKKNGDLLELISA